MTWIPTATRNPTKKSFSTPGESQNRKGGGRYFKLPNLVNQPLPRLCLTSSEHKHNVTSNSVVSRFAGLAPVVRLNRPLGSSGLHASRSRDHDCSRPPPRIR